MPAWWSVQDRRLGAMQRGGALIKVAVFQPVVPHYRVPLFARVAREAGIQLQVHAAMAADGCPPTPTGDLGFLFVGTALRPLAGGRLYAQTGAVVPPGFAQGDVLVLCGNARYVTNYRLLLAARRRGMGVVWWGHLRSVGGSRAGVLLRVWLLMRSADVVLVYTERERDYLVRHGYDSERVVSANNTVDTDAADLARLRWPARRLSEFQAAMGLDPGKTVTYCGRLSGSSELGVAIEALSLLSAQGVRYTLVVVGDGPLRITCAALADRLGVAQQIAWVGGIYAEDGLAPYLLSSSALVHPGPIGLSLLHAFCYGLPVITHDREAHHGPEIAALRAGVNGLFLERGNAAALANAIARLSADPGAACAMRAAARATIDDEYPMRGMVSRFVHAIGCASATAKGAGRWS